MPRKKKSEIPSDKAAQPQFSAAALEQLIHGPVTPAELESIFQQFKKAVVERALGAHEPPPGLRARPSQRAHPAITATARALRPC